ncbi:DUF202 domain-containing protein [Amycolatopsis sp. GM8]|uniref:DUF202 domain-containing protein n=1 Tax=Amycolatopsis sp. GM8 TaxID=2896530 RepID=UPI001F237649|nr:DUF202 domain-containing protein [Amycolatopsis sp. GM8]
MTTRDPGLQPERTTLAWQRTGLSAAVVAVLLIRSGIVGGSPLEIAAGACAAFVVLLCALAARSVPSARVRLWLVTVAVLACGLCTTVSLFLSH